MSTRGALDAPAEPGPPVAITGRPARRRRFSPGDVLRLLFGIGLVLAGLLVAAVGRSTVNGLEADIVRLLARLPSRIADGLLAVAQLLASLVPIIAIAYLLLIHHRYKLVGQLVLAGAVAFAVTAGVDALIQDRRLVQVLDEFDAARGMFTGSFPSSGYVASATAIITVAAPWMSRRWRRTAWGGVTLVVVLRLTASVVPAGDIVLAVGLGVVVGCLALLVFGAPNPEPSPEQLTDALRRVRLEPRSITRLTTRAERPSYDLLDARHGRCFVRIRTPEDREADFLNRAYRWARFRSAHLAAPFASPKRQIEHEVLLLDLAASAGVRAPPVVAFGMTEGDSAFLVQQWVEGARAVELVSPSLRSWTTCGARSRHCTRPASPTTGSRETTCSSTARRIHGCSTSTTRRRPPSPVTWPVTSPTSWSSRPWPPASTPRRAQPSVRWDLRPWPPPSPCCSRWPCRLPCAGASRARSSSCPTCARPSAMPRAHRWSRWRGWSGSGPRRSSSSSARPSPSTRCCRGSGTSTTRPRRCATPSRCGSVPSCWPPPSRTPSPPSRSWAASPSRCPRRRPCGRSWRPPSPPSSGRGSSGGLAVGVRFLERSGEGAAESTAAVALNAVAGTAVHVVLLFGFVLWTGKSGVGRFSLPDANVVLLVLSILAAVVGTVLLVRPLRQRLLVPAMAAVRAGLAQVGRVFRSPGRVIALVGGSAGLTLAYVGGLMAAVLAFGGRLTFPQVGTAYLAATALAALAPTPGGLGAVESALIAALTGFGLQDGLAVSAVLTFRLATFWLPILPGWIVFGWMQRHSEL